MRSAAAIGLALSILLVAFAGSAGANLLPAASRSLPIRAGSLGGLSVGTGTLTVSYTDSHATATASAPSVSLGKGQLFRVQVCIKAHSVNSSFDTRCDDKTVDTRSLLNTISVTAPTATATLARPAGGGRAYFSSVVSVTYRLPNGSFAEAATSWPAAGLGGAYVGVPAVGAATAAAPASEGVLLSNKKTGGINTGLPDSMCGQRAPIDGEPPGEGVSNAGLGGDAPAYYEVGEPTGEHAGSAPKGVMMVIHGGGSSIVGPAAVATMRADADRWRARGWRTLNVTYRPCGESFGDVRWFYDRAREVWGDSVPYCTLGASAGGNLALMIAHARPTVACTIDQSGPTDALALKSQTTPAGGSDGPRWLHNLMVSFAGPENLHWWSPARFPIAGRGIPARVMFAVAAGDPYVPYEQGTVLKSRMTALEPGAYVDTMRLVAGDRPWVHANVSQTALDYYFERERQLVAPLVAPG